MSQTRTVEREWRAGNVTFPMEGEPFVNIYCDDSGEPSHHVTGRRQPRIVARTYGYDAKEVADSIAAWHALFLEQSR